MLRWARGLLSVPMRRMLRALLALFVLLQHGSVGADSAGPSSAAVWPASGHIVFDVLRGEGGIKLGVSEHRWQHDGRRYSMQTRIETTGVADLVLNFSYVQRSEGLIGVDGLQPEQFVIEQAGRARQLATFDWSAGNVLIERKGKSVRHAVRARDQDLLSMWHLAAVTGGRELSGELGLISGRRVEPAVVESRGSATIQLPIGAVDTLRVRTRARSGKLTVDLWLSQEHGLLPVRIVITDDKGQVLDQQAVSMKLNAAQQQAGTNAGRDE